MHRIRENGMDQIYNPAYTRQAPELSVNSVFAILGAFLLLGAFLAPPAPFIVDGGVYLDMARAMAGGGALHIAGNGGMEGAPALTKYLTVARDGLVYPQYPSGYAFVAAPFYKLFGVKGLMAMNAIATLACVWLTHRIALKLYPDQRVALYAALVFLFATFMSNYALAIWPHALSLSLWLATVFCAVKGNATGQAGGRPGERAGGRFIWFALAGLAAGAGLNIRVDTILAAIAVLFWLRLFARPSDRLAAPCLLAGLMPGLLIAAYFNFLKFGVFSPFSYGATQGAAHLGSYLPVLAGGGAALAAICVVNIPAMLTAAHNRAGAGVAAGAIAITGLMVLIFAGEPLAKALYGVYVLVFNLQAHDAYYQAGVELNEFGQLMFWDFPKRALVQSLPFLPLLLVPVYDFFRGRNLTAVSLCLLAIAAPISFYALNQWHGGGSYNMRYFIPALPFIAILSAVAITRLADAAGGVVRQQALMIIVAAAAIFIGLDTIGKSIPALYAPMALYPQWVIAAVLGAVVIFFIIKPQSKPAARAALAIGVFALAYGGAVNFMDEVSHEKARASQLAFSQDIARAITGAPLVLTQIPVLLLHAEAEGASVMVATEKNIAAAREAVNAFADAERCVYFHNSLMRNLMAASLPVNALTRTPYWAISRKTPDDPRLAFYGLASQRERCAF